MTQFIPSPVDCCRPCCRDSVVVVNVASGQEIYEGHGNPNGQIAPDNTAKPAEYHNLDTPGETWWWIVADQAWS